MFKSMKTKVVAVATGAAVLATQAFAALTAPTISTTDFETVAGAVLVGAAVMWAIKKAMGLLHA